MQRVEAWSIGTSSPPMCSSPRRVDASLAILAWPASVVNRAMFLSNDGTVRGTPLYMAPEQLRGEAPTPAWDVYALALMATELLSGSHPLAGMSVRGAVEAHLDGGAASAAAAALPAPVLAVLRSGLASPAADRPTARQLADRLVDAAPMAWFGVTADHVPLVASSSAAAPAALGTHAEDADGLWAGGKRAGWTVELVDASTWHGSSEAERDRLSIVEASPNSHSCPGSPAVPAARRARRRQRLSTTSG